MSATAIRAPLRDGDRLIERLKALLRFPSIAMDPGFAQGMAGARHYLLDYLREIGLANVQELDGGGQPAVYGEWLGAPGRPTILVYGHYDVQPPDPLELWTTPPFEPVMRDGCIFARGAADAKGPTLVALETVAAFLADGGCPVNIKIFLEGEEENGSPSVRTLIDRHRALLAADVMLSADGSGDLSPDLAGLPAVVVGTRGSVQCNLAVRTGARDLHSGLFGGVTRNAALELSKLLATLHDPRGRIAVDGMLDDVEAITDEQRIRMATLPFDEADFRAALGGPVHGEPEFSITERLTLRPCLDVTGLWSGYLGEGHKNVIPSEAFAKLSMRLVAGQKPERVVAALAAHIARHCPPGVQASCEENMPGTIAYNVPDTHPLLLAVETVIARRANRPPLRVVLGCTLPISAIFKETLGIDTVMFGCCPADSNLHAPNEFMPLSSLDEGLRDWPILLTELGRLSAEQFAPFR